jgi:hypothetical protein
VIWTRVSSSNLLAVGFAPDVLHAATCERATHPNGLHPCDCAPSVGEAGTLDVRFANGGHYRYFAVPTAIYVSLMNAVSIGTYFATAVRAGGYRWEKLAGPPVHLLDVTGPQLRALRELVAAHRSHDQDRAWLDAATHVKTTIDELALLLEEPV